MKPVKPNIGIVQRQVRPHPGPLPQERGKYRPLSRETTALGSVTLVAANEQGVMVATKPIECSGGASLLSLSLGERAGVRASICLILLLLLSATLVHAQFAIDWFKIAGGGGTSTGGVYSVSGTIGQLDASGPMTNGQYSLVGGFWVLPIAVQDTNAPTLTIAPATPGNAVISWTPNTPGFVLQENLSLSPTTWTNSLSGATNPVIVPATFPAKFYRLFKP